jgi:hypothetical protein
MNDNHLEKTPTGWLFSTLAVIGLLVGAALSGVISGFLGRAGLAAAYANAVMLVLIGLILYPVLLTIAQAKGYPWRVRFWAWAAGWVVAACFSALVIYPLLSRLL